MIGKIHDTFRTQVLCRLGRHEPIRVIEQFEATHFTYAELDKVELQGFVGESRIVCRWCWKEMDVAP